MSASATQGGHKEERNYRMKILWSALLHRATITIIKTDAVINVTLHYRLKYLTPF